MRKTRTERMCYTEFGFGVQDNKKEVIRYGSFVKMVDNYKVYPVPCIRAFLFYFISVSQVVSETSISCQELYNIISAIRHSDINRSSHNTMTL